MKAKQSIITMSPVRAIKRATYHNITAVKNALWAAGYDTRYFRHMSLDKLLGQLPKPVLERVLVMVSPK